MTGAPQTGRPPTVWDLLRRGPLILWGLVAAWLVVASYPLLFLLTKHMEGNPTRVTWYALVLPPVGLGTVATLLLALGTAALAYAAVRQAQSAESLLASAEGQADATKRLAEAAETQAQASRAQVDTAHRQLDLTQAELDMRREEAALLKKQAETAEALRRSTTFPEVKVVTVQAGADRTPVPLLPGNRYLQWGIPAIGVHNFGNGPARSVKVSASWKVLDFGKVPSASEGDVTATSWTPAPVEVPETDRIDARSGFILDMNPWLNTLAAGRTLTKRPVAVYIRVSWTDPDQNRVTGLKGGLLFLPGTTRTDPTTSLVVEQFIGLGAQDCPPDSMFSKEPTTVFWRGRDRIAQDGTK